MKTEDPLAQSITESLDGSDTGLLPFFEYLLQDIWEIGASPDVILKLIKKHSDHSGEPLKILDLGCGKGAVSIHLAKNISCRCTGTDAYAPFIESARAYAGKHGVEQQCHFEQGDIRMQTGYLSGYDVVILGSIGHVLGSLENTLNSVKRCIHEQGLILVDDAFLATEETYSANNYQPKNELLDEIKNSGLRILDEYLYTVEALALSNERIYRAIEKRASELIEKFPARKQLFTDYLDSQKLENDLLENKVQCVTWVLKKG